MLIFLIIWALTASAIEREDHQLCDRSIISLSLTDQCNQTLDSSTDDASFAPESEDEKDPEDDLTRQVEALEWKLIDAHTRLFRSQQRQGSRFESTSGPEDSNECKRSLLQPQVAISTQTEEAAVNDGTFNDWRIYCIIIELLMIGMLLFFIRRLKS